MTQRAVTFYGLVVAGLFFIYANDIYNFAYLCWAEIAWMCPILFRVQNASPIISIRSDIRLTYFGRFLQGASAENLQYPKEGMADWRCVNY